MTRERGIDQEAQRLKEKLTHPNEKESALRGEVVDR